VFGHADPTGSDAFNKALAGRRADALYGVLTRSVDVWEELYKAPHGDDDWGQRELCIMLFALGYAPSTTPANGAVFQSWVRGFQEEHDLAPDGIPGPLTRKALFARYFDHLCVRADGTPYTVPIERFVGAGHLPKRQGATQGCGELNPVRVRSKSAAAGEDKQKAERDKRNAANRRVLVYILDDDLPFESARWPCPTTADSGARCEAELWSDGKRRRAPGDDERTFRQHRDTFACRFYHGLAMRSPCEVVSAMQPASVRLVDPFGEPVVAAPVHFHAGGVRRVAMTGPDGVAQTSVPEGDVVITLTSGQVGHAGEAAFAFSKHADPPEPGASAADQIGPSRAIDDPDLWADVQASFDELPYLEPRGAS
jgi:hypothetical protein